MRKNELLDLHEQMVTVKEMFEDMPDVSSDAFAAYEEEVSPDDVGRSKEAHKRAVFVLGEELADLMCDDEFSDVGRIKDRMTELSESIEA